jgi:hypothetical protein
MVSDTSITERQQYWLDHIPAAENFASATRAFLQRS